MSIYPPFGKWLGFLMKTRGVYPRGFPVGAVVHYTAGAGKAPDVIHGGVKQGYAYWCIQRDGQLYCAHPVNRWGYHAGESAWKKMLKKLIGGVSDDLIGIEIIAAGTVKPTSDGKFKTYWGATLPAEDVRYTEGKDNQAKGYYHKYTPEQEKTLVETLMWLKTQQPDIFDFDFVLGHDEVSGPMGIGYFRKTDPGAALSMTMPKFREFLKAEWNKRQKPEVTLT